eukprot:2459298-Pleurochrysis_carterae.AAC.2
MLLTRLGSVFRLRPHRAIGNGNGQRRHCNRASQTVSVSRQAGNSTSHLTMSVEYIQQLSFCHNNTFDKEHVLCWSCIFGFSEYPDHDSVLVIFGKPANGFMAQEHSKISTRLFENFEYTTLTFHRWLHSAYC